MGLSISIQILEIGSSLGRNTLVFKKDEYKDRYESNQIIG